MALQIWYILRSIVSCTTRNSSERDNTLSRLWSLRTSSGGVPSSKYSIPSSHLEAMAVHYALNSICHQHNALAIRYYCNTRSRLHLAKKQQTDSILFHRMYRTGNTNSRLRKQISLIRLNGKVKILG